MVYRLIVMVGCNILTLQLLTFVIIIIIIVKSFGGEDAWLF